MEVGIAAYSGRRGTPQTVPFDLMALLFARSAGVEPELHRWLELARELMFGPADTDVIPMNGRDSLPDAPKRFATEFQAFGCMKSQNFTPEQIAQLQALAGARGDVAFSRYVENVCSRGNAASAT
jgi:dimethylaniline monooxygenase (N-oxide forming)